MNKRKLIAESKLRLINKHIAYFNSLAQVEEIELKKLKPSKNTVIPKCFGCQSYERFVYSYIKPSFFTNVEDLNKANCKSYKLKKHKWLKKKPQNYTQI